MSFDKRKLEVDEGDTIVLYMGRQPVSLEIDTTKTFQSKFGAFPHKKFIGKKYGSKVYSSNGKGWVYVLQPTPELWTVTLPHRTQILYTMDISMIMFELEVRPGSIVVESGTGSGSLSHAIIRTIKPDGHLHTFDFHENRVLKAKEEFDKHYGKERYVTCTCADVCANGFSLMDKADAVFLDLPAPWDAIPYAKVALKKSGGRICSFSPCIEQVQRSCEALRKAEFCEIKTIECLVRPMNVATVALPELIFDCEDDNGGETESKKIRLEADDSSAERTNGNTDEVKEKSESEAVDLPKSGDVTGLNSYGMVTKLTAKNKKGNINVLTCKPNKEVTGHTGYLTFASLYPFDVVGET